MTNSLNLLPLLCAGADENEFENDVIQGHDKGRRIEMSRPMGRLECLFFSVTTVLLCAVSSSSSLSHDDAPMSVSVPRSHVAMEEDLEVTFSLARANAFSFNAMIHIEYLPGEILVYVLHKRGDNDGTHPQTLIPP